MCYLKNVCPSLSMQAEMSGKIPGKGETQLKATASDQVVVKHKMQETSNARGKRQKKQT